MRREHVTCPTCGWIAKRMRREDGPVFGRCPTCQEPMEQRKVWAKRQDERAKADLQRYEEPA
jgi:uncharacterized Zn finger protein (UPF0148 family)